MATIERRAPGQFRARIRRDGYPPRTRALAEAWAREIESKIDTGEPVLSAEAARTTLREALDRYEREITPSKRGARQERRRIARWRAHPLGASGFIASPHSAHHIGRSLSFCHFRR